MAGMVTCLYTPHLPRPPPCTQCRARTPIRPTSLSWRRFPPRSAVIPTQAKETKQRSARSTPQRQAAQDRTVQTQYSDSAGLHRPRPQHFDPNLTHQAPITPPFLIHDHAHTFRPIPLNTLQDIPREPRDKVPLPENTTGDRKLLRRDSAARAQPALCTHDPALCTVSGLSRPQNSYRQPESTNALPCNPCTITPERKHANLRQQQHVATLEPQPSPVIFFGCHTASLHNDLSCRNQMEGTHKLTPEIHRGRKHCPRGNTCERFAESPCRRSAVLARLQQTVHSTPTSITIPVASITSHR